MTTYKTIDEIKQANEDAGRFWFSPGALRFFNSHIHSPVFGGRYFVSSERFDETYPKLFTVHRINDEGHIETIGEFQQYETLDDAQAAAILEAEGN